MTVRRKGVVKWRQKPRCFGRKKRWPWIESLASPEKEGFFARAENAIGGEAVRRETQGKPGADFWRENGLQARTARPIGVLFAFFALRGPF